MIQALHFFSLLYCATATAPPPPSPPGSTPDLVLVQNIVVVHVIRNQPPQEGPTTSNHGCARTNQWLYNSVLNQDYLNHTVECRYHGNHEIHREHLLT